ncbi:Diacylglycerol kinase iota [Camelus dromedarius]|uniref:Diacylglycerol kinase iota n=1 Tax=Camelus dromedarius TaxID=9838 RepID=A0A5N4DZS8_CAMDR|nr:Diacylglycerol kinase iota [Camelus dromedarius]
MLIESYKNGGSLLIQGPDHCSLLHYAAKTGNGEIVKYILDHVMLSSGVHNQEDACPLNRSRERLVILPDTTFSNVPRFSGLFETQAMGHGTGHVVLSVMPPPFQHRLDHFSVLTLRGGVDPGVCGPSVGAALSAPDDRPSELLDMADSETGETALHKAACQRNRAVCQLLVDAGASLRKTDSKGKTPQDRAQQAGDPDLAAYLESRQNYKIIGHEDLETAV